MTTMVDPARKVAAVTPSDSTDLGPVRGLYVGTGGNVAIMCEQNAAAVTLVGVPTGTILPVRAVKVMSTNTTASDIVALY